MSHPMVLGRMLTSGLLIVVQVGKVKLGNDAVSMARLQLSKWLSYRRGEIKDGKMETSRVTAEGNVAKGPSIAPFK